MFQLRVKNYKKGESIYMGRRRRRRRKTGTGWILLFVLIIFCTVTYARGKLDHTRASLLERQEEVEAQILEEQERSSQIEDLGAYVQTKKFVEETAREKLGLVYEDEVIFQSGD